ncbi:MAG TPA: hypothetical protein DCL15_02625 [Chloroflexi bacterium]|nr:hypothetical protein [Chloroflexota bacterium]
MQAVLCAFFAPLRLCVKEGNPQAASWSVQKRIQIVQRQKRSVQGPNQIAQMQIQIVHRQNQIV